MSDASHRSAPSATRLRRTGLWATGGAALTAVLSSACCWLPLLLIAFGASAAGVAGFFEEWRPWLLGATGLLLAAGFYLVYFRRARCAPGSACAVPDRRLTRFNKISLWVATAVVLAFGLFPNYVGLLLRGSAGGVIEGAALTDDVRRFRIAGMTCEACATGLAARLRSVPGVRGAEVDYESAIATVRLGAGA